jgi:hypothetical protein
MGRDEDRKYRLRKSENRGRRIRHAIRHWRTMMGRATRKVVTKRTLVEMPLWEMPFALLVGWGYYTILFTNQVASVAGWSAERVEHIPDIFEPQ